MVHIVQLDETTYVTGQIHSDDVAEIAGLGVHHIVNNRPDGEEGPMQPAAAEIEAAAIRNSLGFVNLPFATAQLTPGEVASFANILGSAQGPILAYCRTGNRSCMLWAAAKVARGADLDMVLGQALRAGYDLRPAASLIRYLGEAAGMSQD